MQGNLFLLPNLLSETNTIEIIPDKVCQVIRSIKYFIIENPKPAHKLLKMAGVPTPFVGISFMLNNKQSNDEEKTKWLIPALQGHHIGLITDAGYPAIADPGENIVFLAHQNNIKVVPISGGSSILLALAASGLNAEQFSFHGYLPIKPDERNRKIKKLIDNILKSGYTQIFIETPYRNNAILNELTGHCPESLILSIASDLTSSNELIITKKIKDWKNTNINLHKIPTVFCLGC